MPPQVAAWLGGCGLWTWQQKPEVHVHGHFPEAILRVDMLPSQCSPMDRAQCSPPNFCHLTGGRYYVAKGETEAVQEVISGASSSHCCLNSAVRGGGRMGDGQPLCAFSGPGSPCSSQGLSAGSGWPAPAGRVKAGTETCLWVP